MAQNREIYDPCASRDLKKKGLRNGQGRISLLRMEKCSSLFLRSDYDHFIFCYDRTLVFVKMNNKSEQHIFDDQSDIALKADLRHVAALRIMTVRDRVLPAAAWQQTKLKNGKSFDRGLSVFCCITNNFIFSGILWHWEEYS